MSGEKKITGIFFGKTEPPCVPDCERRCAGCHSTCQKYKDWKSKVDADRERRNELNRAKQEVDEYVTKTKLKNCKKHHHNDRVSKKGYKNV